MKKTTLVLLTVLLSSCMEFEYRPCTFVIKKVERASKNLYVYSISSVSPNGGPLESFTYRSYESIGMPGDTVKLVKYGMD